MRRSLWITVLVLWSCTESAAPLGVGLRPVDMGTPCAPAPERCNGDDDDCDGRIDESAQDVDMPCGVGACAGGTTRCEAGELTCDGAAAPSDELCNGLDDDCDGRVDEDATREADPASPTVGQACPGCPNAIFECADGSIRCRGAMDEICDGADNDCDGQTDESFPGADAPCGQDTGLCVAGVQSCIDGIITCAGSTAPTEERCDDADNDCDGETDEGLDDCQVIDLPCTTDDECPTGLCFDDQGLRYCTRACSLDAADCPDGYRCEVRDQQTVCTRIYPTCETPCPGAGCILNCGCPAGTACTLGPRRDPTRIVRECRPPVPNGRPVGAPCSPDRFDECDTGYCSPATGRCSRACCAQADCGPDTVCVLSPFRTRSNERLEVGLCLTACTGDAECADVEGDPICRYRGDPEEMEYRGACTQANFEGVSLGDACQAGQECRHGLCYVLDDGAGYCIRGCANEADCPEDWRCNETRIGVRSIRICQP